MSGSSSSQETAALIGRLSGELRPVRRLARPGWRAAGWLSLVGLGGVLLAVGSDLPAVGRRLAAAPDMWLSVAGSVSTAITAAVAALLVALPDRDPRWAWLPLPPGLLWLGASGAGCLRADALVLWQPASMAVATTACLPFILEVSAVLALPLGILLWRARPLRLALVAWLGGLAVAAASASLLWLHHPFDASWVDVMAHGTAVGVVMGASRLVALLLPE